MWGETVTQGLGMDDKGLKVLFHQCGVQGGMMS